MQYEISDFFGFQGFQGGVTEGQMLKFMGANTHLSMSQAKKLLEVHYGFGCPFYSSIVLVSQLFFFYFLFNVLFLFQDESLGFAYTSQREARPSLYGCLPTANYIYLFFLM